MNTMTTQIEKVYTDNIWLLLSGRKGHTELAKESGISRCTITSRVRRDRVYWGGKDAAKLIAEKALAFDPALDPRVLKKNKKIRAVVVQRALAALEQSLPDFNNSPVPQDVEEIYKKSAKHVSATINKLCNSEGLSPQDLESLANAADGWTKLQYRIEDQRFRRKRRVLDLEEREEKVELREQAVTAQAQAIALLAHDLNDKKEQLIKASESLAVEKARFEQMEVGVVKKKR